MQSSVVSAVASLAVPVYYVKKKSEAQKKQLRNSNAIANKEYELKKQQTQMTLAEQQRKNRNLLSKQQSAYKAKLGASGLSSSSGSGQVVLDSMQKEHDMEDKYLTQQANISLESLMNGINDTNARNLLAIKNSSVETQQSYLNSLGTSGRTLLK